MSTTPNVPYRLEFSVEVPGTPEQVWQAIATAKGMSAWFLPTEMEEREGGSLHFSMGPEMGSDGHVTGWDPPHRIVYEEDWAALMGKDPDALSPLTSEFLVEAQSGGTCSVMCRWAYFSAADLIQRPHWRLQLHEVTKYTPFRLTTDSGTGSRSKLRDESQGRLAPRNTALQRSTVIFSASRH